MIVISGTLLLWQQPFASVQLAASGRRARKVAIINCPRAFWHNSSGWSVDGASGSGGSILRCPALLFNKIEFVNEIENVLRLLPKH